MRVRVCVCLSALQVSQYGRCRWKGKPNQILLNRQKLGVSVQAIFRKMDLKEFT